MKKCSLYIPQNNTTTVLFLLTFCMCQCPFAIAVIWPYIYVLPFQLPTILDDKQRIFASKKKYWQKKILAKKILCKEKDAKKAMKNISN